MAIAVCLTLTPAAAFGCGARDQSSRAEQTLREENTQKTGQQTKQTTSGSQEERPEKDTPDTPEEDKRQEKTSQKEEDRASGDDRLALVDREHGLSEDYEPGDLVELSEHEVPTVDDREMMLRDEAAKALSELIEDAESAGVELVVRSAYRSHEHQIVSYENWTAVYGERESGLSAPPGHSEHQLGTVADFTNAAAGYELGQWFGDTRASGWLTENAARHGFIMSYPKDSRQHTGYKWEPWHYRYIGPDNASRYRQSDHESPRQFLLEEGVIPSGSEDTETPDTETRPASSGSNQNEDHGEDTAARGAG